MTNATNMLNAWGSLQALSGYQPSIREALDAIAADPALTEEFEEFWGPISSIRAGLNTVDTIGVDALMKAESEAVLRGEDLLF